MEKWLNVFEGVIPKGKYQSEVKHDNMSGLTIVLKDADCEVDIDFGVIVALRILDEGIVLNNIYSNSEISRLKENDFSNTIYQIENGELSHFIKKVGNEMYEYMDMKHYCIITLNHVIEVITEWEPEVKLNA